MLNEIKNKYGNFHDAVIFEVSYLANQRLPGSSAEKRAIVTLQAENQHSGAFDKIRLNFYDVTKFRFFEDRKVCSTVVFEAFVEKMDEVIVFDFFALQADGKNIREDPDSDFVIHCKRIEFETLG